MEKRKWQTNNIKEFENVVKEILSYIKNLQQDSFAIGLIGDLGAGKTTFSKIFAKELGVDSEVQSPTFTIMKIYETKDDKFKQIIHVDAYRIDSLLEAQNLKLTNYFNSPGSLSIIEWPENIKQILPESTIFIEILHAEHEDLQNIEKRQINLLG